MLTEIFVFKKRRTLMKITSIDVYDFGKCLNYEDCSPICIRINTDAGISGFGEVGLAYGNAHNAGVWMVKDFGQLIIGKDPLRSEAIREQLFRTTFWGMGGGTVINAGMSAIDIALWDIKGKYYNAPVYQLLGGKINEKLRAYASQIQFDWDLKHAYMKDPGDYARAARKAMADGYTAVKVDPLMVDEHAKRNPKHTGYGILPQFDLNMAVDRVTAIRETSPDLDIIIELHSFLSCNAAIQLAEKLRPLRIFYYEEPMHSMHVENMELIARTINIPVATGERVYTRWGYRPFLEKRALAVVQPDICLAGGITETKKICDLANIYDATVQIHVCGGPVSKAAALHMETAIPNFLIHEHHSYALKQCIRELCTQDYQPVRGQYQAPELPGLGQELNDEVVKQYLVATVK